MQCFQSATDVFTLFFKARLGDPLMNLEIAQRYLIKERKSRFPVQSCWKSSCIYSEMETLYSNLVRECSSFLDLWKQSESICVSGILVQVQVGQNKRNKSQVLLAECFESQTRYIFFSSNHFVWLELLSVKIVNVWPGII